ncbi:MAG: MBL fold metallo-hydrolase [Caldiserica bacterium]|nr:MBL fold metallo-hydrolase [Caldisericota bacterium]
MEGLVKWLGHASVRIEGDSIIYIDPWKLKGKEIKADIVLITHDHYDHCSLEDIDKVRKTDTKIVAPYSCQDKLKGEIHFVKPGDKLTFRGIEIEVVPAYNIEKRFHPREYEGVGYIVTTKGIRIYHAGDTDYIPEMENIKADIVLLPVGGVYTMDAEEAGKVVSTINPRLAIPIHYGSIVGNLSDAEKFKELCGEVVKILPLQN